tara:strand:+ start:30 stop:362 length:333 start_codon:yes stop_codon:yes gene_type:complete
MGKQDLILQAIKMGVSASKIIAKYGKKAYNAAKKRYEDKDVGPALQLSKDVMVGLPTMGALAAISDKRNYKNKTKPKKEKYNPRLKRGLRSGGTVNSRAIAKKYFKGGIA